MVPPAGRHHAAAKPIALESVDEKAFRRAEGGHL